LIQFGHSKDRDDLPQVKIAIAALDPLGMPLTTVVVPGNSADDPLYVPEIRKVQQDLGAGGKTHVGDCKMASLGTRAYVADSGDYYLCPLPERQLSREERRSLLQPVWTGKQSLEQVHRPPAKPGGAAELVAEGFAVKELLRGEIDGRPVEWTECRWFVRSVALAQRQQQGLDQRLSRAQEQLEQLGRRKRGKKRLTAEEMSEAAEAIVVHQRVQGLLHTQVEAKTWEREVRSYGTTPAHTVKEEEHRVAVTVQAEAIEQAKREMGWQVYATNRVATTLAESVWAYRGQYCLEDDWSRLKGKPLGLTPIYLADEWRLMGLVLLLSVALRVLTVMEWGVRKKLKESGEKLTGLYPGQEGRQTARPSAELLLRAFRGISWVVVAVAGQVATFLKPLTGLQQRLLALWELPGDLYSRLTLHFAEPPPS
jgi:transposase